MSNLPNGIVYTGTHGHWTGTRPGHLQEITVDCFRIDWGRLGRLEGWLIAVPPVRTGLISTECRQFAVNAGH